MVKCLTFVLFSLLAGSNSVAQWSQLPGPCGGAVNEFAMSASTGFTYAATSNGIFVSKDHLKSWKEAGLQGASPGTVLTYQTSAKADVLFAITEPSNINLQILHRSTDAGATWTVLDTFQQPVGWLLQDGQRLLLAVDSFNVNDTPGILQSTDLGQSWTRFAYLPPHISFTGGWGYQTALITGGFLVTLTWDDSGMWRLPLSGGAWQKLNPPLASGSRYVANMAMAGTNLYASGYGVSVSTDVGVSWTHPANAGLAGKGELGMVAVNGSRMIAASLNGLCCSTDAGQSWIVEDTAELPHFWGTGVLEFIDGSFITGIMGGPTVSADGLNWSYASEGMHDAAISDLTSDGKTLFAITGRGVSHSSDHGLTWHHLSETTIFHGWWNLRQFAKIGSSVYVTGELLLRWNGSGWDTISRLPIQNIASLGSALFAAVADSGIMKSTDRGASWTRMKGGLLVDSGYALRIVSIDNVLYSEVLFEASSTSVDYSSADSGRTWMQAMNLPGYFFMGEVGIIKETLYCAGGRALEQRLQNEQYWFEALRMDSDHPVSNFLRPFRAGLLLGADTGSHHPCLYYLDSNGIFHALSSGLGLPSATTADDEYIYGAFQNSLWSIKISDLPLAVSRHGDFAMTEMCIFPNPLTTKTTIRFSLPERTHVSLKLYDELGILRNTIFEGEREAGSVEIPFEDGALPNGVYTVQLSTPIKSAVARLLKIEPGLH